MSYAVNRFLEPFTECASVSDDKDRYCILIRTGGLLSSYAHRALSVIVDNKCGF